MKRVTQMRGRPNFVVVVADQLRADALGCFGNVLAKTPNLDNLARSGAIFTQAYVQHPLCAPSRASILTGWYPHVRGHRTNNYLLQPHEPNLLRTLKEAGYHVTVVGSKGHMFAPGATEISAHEYGFGYGINYGFDHGVKSAGGDVFPTPRFASEDWARVEYLGCTNETWQDKHDEPAICTVERWLAAPPPEPWVLLVPLLAPHPPFGACEPWFSLYERTAMPAPRPVTVDNGPEFRDGIRKKYELDRITPEMWSEVSAVYFGMVARLDQHVGRINHALMDAGLDARTVTLFFADHGEYLGDFGLIEKWWSGMERCLTQSPVIISGGTLPQGQRIDGLVEMVDIMPTILDLAGVEAKHVHFGRSLVPLINNPARQHRRYAFTEGGFSLAEEPQMEKLGIPGRSRGANFRYATTFKIELAHEEPRLAGRAIAVRDTEWTYIWRLYESPELYHRVDDPNELINRAGDPHLREIELRMKEAILHWQVETSDVLPINEDPYAPSIGLPKPGERRQS